MFMGNLLALFLHAAQYLHQRRQLKLIISSEVAYNIDFHLLMHDTCSHDETMSEFWVNMVVNVGSETQLSGLMVGEAVDKH